MEDRVQHRRSNPDLHVCALRAALAFLFLAGIVASLPAQAQSFSVLHSFACGPTTDGTLQHA
jgi:hypothetical protein